MATQNDVGQTLTSSEFMDTMIRLGAIGLLLILCLQVFSPFVNLMIWALVLAVALYPLHQKLARRLKDRQGRAATLMVVIGLLLIGGPVVMLGTSFASHMQTLHADYKNNDLTLPHPDAGVADWPVIGNEVYDAWEAAADNLPVFVEQNRAALDDFARRGLSAASNTLTGVLLFLVALIIAGIMMGFGQSGNAAMQRIFCRFAGDKKGINLQKLSTMTVRSVAAGVIGVAFIQALLLGVGFVFSGVPAAGLLAIITMVIGIVQLPALIISLPVIVYLWLGGDASTASNIVWSIYLLIAGTADNFLKPLLLGRGVDAPMPVILMGALGGMFTAGIVGLFVGSTLLALGYQIFMDWVGRGSETVSPEPELPAAE